MNQPLGDDDDRLRDILDRTRFNALDGFIKTSVLGFLVAGLLLIVGYRSSTGTFLLLALLAAAVAVASAMEHRIWRMVQRRRFVRNAARSGFTRSIAGRFWDRAVEQADDFNHDEEG